MPFANPPPGHCSLKLSGGGAGRKEETTPVRPLPVLLGKGTKPGGDSNKQVLPAASCTDGEQAGTGESKLLMFLRTTLRRGSL